MMIADMHHHIIIVDIIILDLMGGVDRQLVFTIYWTVYGKEQKNHLNRVCLI
jgi:hypothetical protein